MSNTTRTLSAKEQKIIISNANFAAAKFAVSYIDELGVKNIFSKADIEEIAGDTIAKACISIDSYDPEKGALSTWVSNIANNCVRTHYKEKLKRLPISNELIIKNEDNEMFELDEVCDKRKGFNDHLSKLFSEYEADRNLEENDFDWYFRREIRKLSEKNQRFAKMLEDGYGPKEMAEAEKCTADAAGKRIWIIRNTLRGPLKEISAEFNIPFRKHAC